MSKKIVILDFNNDNLSNDIKSSQIKKTHYVFTGKIGCHKKYPIAHHYNGQLQNYFSACVDRREKSKTHKKNKNNFFIKYFIICFPSKWTIKNLSEEGGQQNNATK